MSPFALYALAGEVSYLIAIPAIVFGVGGAYLDTYAETSPLFLLLGFALAFSSSALAVWRMIKRVSKQSGV